MPKLVSCLLTRAAPGVWREPAKQCAKMAKACGGESGKSMVPAIVVPVLEGSDTFTDCMTIRI